MDQLGHPSLADLVESSGNADVQEHLSSCPPCRARARLFEGLEDVTPEDLPGFAVAVQRLRATRDRAQTSLGLSLGGVAPLPTDLEAGRVLERYRVVERVARGGMGTVYRVEHTGLGSTHALKVIHRTAVSVRERVVREGRAQSKLRHPHLVPVTDIVDVDGTPGLIMEFVDGPTLAERLLEGPLPLDEVDELGSQILRGVAAAHAQGVVHRDIKPANVLLAPTDEGRVAKVTDFGLARELDLQFDEAAQLTGPDRPMGTPSYMAPEQIRDARSADVRSDVWSLGALLYELATSHRAFPGADLISVYDKVRAGTYTPPREHAPQLPQRMVDAIEGALVTDRDLRFPDVRSLLETWRGTASSEPTVEIPRPVPAPLRAARRPMWAAAALAAGSFAAAGLVALVVLSLSRAARGPTDGVGPEPAPRAPALAPPRPAADRQLTALPDDIQIYCASLSPDGSTVVYADGRGIWVQPVREGSARPVVEGVDVQTVHFFPDGQRVLIAGRREGHGGVWALGIDGSSDVRLSDESALWARVSPDGTRVAMADASGLWVADADGSGRTRLRPLAAGDGTSGLEWSPSGRYLVGAHSSQDGGAPWLEVTAADGSATRRLVEHHGLLGLNLAPLAWLAPDTLVYGLTDAKEETPVVRIYALDHAETAIDVSKARLVHQWNGFFVTRLRPDATGTRIVYSRVTANSSVQIFDLASGTKRGLTREDWVEAPLGWLDDGRVLVRSNRGGGGVVARRLADGEPQQVSSLLGMADWARPIGDAIHYTRLDSEKWDERGALLGASLPLGGGEEKVWLRLEATGEQSMGLRKRFQARCVPSEDSMRCLMGRPLGSGLVFAWVDVRGGTFGPPVLSLPEFAQGAWDLADDGRRLAVLGSSPGILGVYDLETGEWLVERSFDSEMVRHIAWAPSGDALYAAVLSSDARQPYQVLQVSLPEGRMTTLVSSMTAFNPTVYPSPDGAHLALGEHFFADDLWMLEGVSWADPDAPTE